MKDSNSDHQPSAWAHHWTLDPAVTFLNHGSFGACPEPVLQVQGRIRQRLESDPVRFFLREFEGLLDAARADLAGFVGADPDDLAFVPNATAGVNTVLRSLHFEPGDELLVTNHEYNASRNALDFAAARTGARVVIAAIPFPIDSPEQVIEALLERVTHRTRLALVDHVTSPTGLVIPIARVVRDLESRGVDALVDGAHAPGMLPLDLDAIGSAYYTGNCHKWLCAPKGAAFLHVRPDRQEGIHPLSISHGASARRTDRSRFRLLFDWTGTDDPSAYLSVPEAIRFMGSLLPGGWTDLMARNRAAALSARAALCRALEIPPPSPEAMIGSLAAVPVPDGNVDAPPLPRDPLQDALFTHHGIEVPVHAWPAPPKRLLRISAQIYNTPDQYDRLAQILRQLLAR